MDCPNCNTLNRSGAKFCRQCGKPLQLNNPQLLSPAPQKPKQKRKNRFLLYAVLLLLPLCICLITTTSVYFWLGLNQRHQIARVIPVANTLALVSFSPSMLQLTQVTNLETIVQSPVFLAPFALIPGIAETALDLSSQFPNDLTIDPVEDVLPWIGHEVSLVVVDNSPQTSERRTSQNRLTMNNSSNHDLLLGIVTRDPERSDMFLNDLRQQLESHDFSFTQETYQEVTITYVTSLDNTSLVYTTVNGLVWLATNKESLYLVIDNGINPEQPTLWDDPFFQATLNQLPTNRLGYVYLPSWQPSLYVPETQNVEIPLLSATTQLGVSISLTSEGTRFDYVTQFDLSKLSFDQRDWLRLSNTEDLLINQTPDDCLLYISSQNVSLTWESLANEWLQGSLNSLEEYSNSNIEGEIFDLFEGQYAGIITQDRDGFTGSGSEAIDALSIGIGVLAQTVDGRQMENNLEDVMLSFDDTSRYLTYTEEIGRESVWYLAYTNRGILGGFMLVDETLIAGSSENILQFMTRRQQTSLADDSLFQTTQRLLPGTYQTFLYLDVAESIRTLDDSLDEVTDNQFSTQWRPYLERVQTIGAITEPMDENGVVTGVIVIVTR